MRRKSREPCEYDVQDLLRSLLGIYFDDVRPEERNPSYAGKSTRVDFLLKGTGIVVEVKMTREGLGEKQVGEQLILDIAHYSANPECTHLICFVYDPMERIRKVKGLQDDLAKQTREGFQLEVIVEPRR